MPSWSEPWGCLVNESVMLRALRNSVHEVLEKMFFAQVLEEEPCSGPPIPLRPAGITARVTFQGEPPGALTMRITSAAARSIAADFLGHDPETVSHRQITEVVCELANMICGSLLSRVEGATTFNLSAPQIVPPAAEPDGGSAITFYAADLSNGTLTVAVTIGLPTCPEPTQFVS